MSRGTKYRTDWPQTGPEIPDQPKSQPATNGDHPPKFKPGHSLAWYANEAIDPTQTLLGLRYLCRSGGMFVVAPSGMGKSTLSLQMAILWCCGLVAFGIKPNGKLRILIVQSEDDAGDCSEMAQVMNHLELTPEQKISVEENTELIRCNDLVSYKFIQALKTRLTEARDANKPFDLVIINPYGVFLGADVKDTNACTKFLNEWLNPILSEFRLGAILIHHTAKTNFQNTEKYSLWDWAYHGAGAACITNWARAILAIKPESENMTLFKFIAAKRGKRIGWENAFERYFAWSSVPGVLRWETATDEQINSASKKTGVKNAEPDEALAQVPIVDPELKDTVLLKIRKTCKVGEKLARTALNQLIVEGKVKELRINKSGQKGSSGHKAVIQCSQDDEN
jgi:hypothetical protein